MVRPRNVLMAWDSSLCSSEASNALKLCQGDLEAAKRYLTEEKIKQAAADRERDEERKRAVIVADREAAAKAAEIQKRNSRSFSEFQHYIKDEDLIGKIISFCDFRETVVIGMTNTRFKKISDNCLDHAADHALTLGGSDESNENELLEVHGAGHDMMYDVRTLRKNEWTYGTRAALVQNGIDACGEKEDLCDLGDLEIEAENFDFNEGRARYLFNTRGNVDVKDFLTDDHDEEMAAAGGWNVSITPMTTEQNISRREAAMEIMLQKHYNLYIKEPGYYDFSRDDEDDEVDHDERGIEVKMANVVLGSPVPAQILQHIFLDKFRRSPNKSVAENNLSSHMVDELARNIVRQKFEQRLPTGDIYDDYMRFLSGEQQSLMEISYTKQQQKQKAKQKAKSQDHDTMDVFNKRHRLHFISRMANYYDATFDNEEDSIKELLSLPVSFPIFTAKYSGGGKTHVVNIYPTIQFLYSHHILQQYINQDVQTLLNRRPDKTRFCADFVASVTKDLIIEEHDDDPDELRTKVKFSGIKQNPQFSLVGIRPGVYLIGMKDQFNLHDRENHPMSGMLQYAVDEIGFVLFDRTNTKSVDDFGPYFIENYILLDLLSKQEMAQNVITYYCKHKDKLDKCLEQYDEKQGKGFICWRFLINQTMSSDHREQRT